jgi:uncharacterized membrane protein YfcA
VSTSVLLVCGLAVLVGALVQGSVGMGLGLIAAPVLAIMDASLVPGTLLLVTASLPLLTALRELGDVDWRGLRWAIAGRLPGTVLGRLHRDPRPPTRPRDPRRCGRPRRRRGKPVAMGGPSGAGRAARRRVRQRCLRNGHVDRRPTDGPALPARRGPRLRSTLGIFFLVGTVVSIAALAVAGELERRDGTRALVLLPFMVAGFLASARLRHRLDRGWTRPAVLAVAAAAATALLVRSML